MGEHYECRGGGDAAAYALGALDDRELSDFRRHLETCSVCESEVESLARLIDVLPMSAPQHPAPRALRGRVIADVKADARRHRAAQEFADARPAGGLLAGGLLAGGLRAGQGLRRLTGPPRRASLIGGAVALAVVLALVLVGLNVSGSTRNAAKAGTRVISASVGSAQVLVSDQHGELIVHHLPQLDAAQTYEVWEQRAGGKPQSTALFNTSDTGDSAINMPGSLQGVQEILVTKEKSGGSGRPHGTPVVVTQLS